DHGDKRHDGQDGAAPAAGGTGRPRIASRRGAGRARRRGAGHAGTHGRAERADDAGTRRTAAGHAGPDAACLGAKNISPLIGSRTANDWRATTPPTARRIGSGYGSIRTLRNSSENTD